MGDLLTSLVPTALVGALAPLPITIVITLLMSRRGLAKAIAFAAAATGVLAVTGLVVLATADTSAASSEGGSAVTGTIIAVLGGVLVILGLKQVFDAPDPDAGPPKLMAKLDTMSPAGAGVLGLIVTVINIKQLGIFVAGVSQIVAADISTADAWIALVILAVVIQLFVIGGIVVYIVARTWATKVLRSFQDWMLRNSRAIAIVLGVGVGVAFLVMGIVQIIG
jgi:threonine/homoserine/homoserine lactone efflux protein